MKITKAMIRRIIREQEEDKLPETPADVETVEDVWSGGDNLELDVDHSKASTEESNIASPEVLELVVAEVRKRLSEKKDQNKDGENDFDDVKIARMKASGMSDEEIKKKHPELFKESALRRKLRKIIKEAVQPMTQKYVMNAFKNMVTFGPNKGMSRGDVVMDKIMSRRYNEAASAVMDALMIDDPPMGADDELAQILKSPSTLEQVAVAAADWGTKHFRMRR